MGFVSDGCLALTGYHAKDLVKSATIAHGDLIHLEDRQTVWLDVQDALSRREPFQLTYRIIHADGKERWVWKQGQGVQSDGKTALEGLITDITDQTQVKQRLRAQESIFKRLPDRHPWQIFGIVSDITDRRSAAQSIQDERDRAQQDIAGVILLAISAEGEITLINQRGNDILGYFQEEIVGKDWLRTCITDRIRSKTARLFDQLMAGKTEFVEYHENPIVTRDGEERTIAWHNTLLRGADETVVGTLSSGEDIIDRLRAEQEKLLMEAQLRQSQKLESIRALASGAAHEINNPLME